MQTPHKCFLPVWRDKSYLAPPIAHTPNLVFRSREKLTKMPISQPNHKNTHTHTDFYELNSHHSIAIGRRQTDSAIFCVL